MSLGLDRHRPVKRCVQQVVVIIPPHQFPQIDLVILAKAEIELSGGGQPHAIAALAEVARQRSDKTQPSTGFLDFPITRRAAGAMVVGAEGEDAPQNGARSEEHTSELQSLMRNSYAVFCLKNKTK